MQLAKILDSNTVLFMLVAMVLLLYFVTDRPFGQIHIVRIGLDAHVPLIPAFSVPYLLFVPAFAGTIIYAYLSNRNFKALALSIIIVYLLSYLVYLAYQTYVPRPAVNGHDVFLSLVRWIYSHDQPYNGMPSTHTSAAVIMAIYYLVSSVRWGWAVVIFSFIVILSTLFVKQHFVLDVISGIALGLVVSSLVFRYLAG